MEGARMVKDPPSRHVSLDARRTLRIGHAPGPLHAPWPGPLATSHTHTTVHTAVSLRACVAALTCARVLSLCHVRHAGPIATTISGRPRGALICWMPCRRAERRVGFLLGLAPHTHPVDAVDEHADLVWRVRNALTVIRANLVVAPACLHRSFKSPYMVQHATQD